MRIKTLTLNETVRRMRELGIPTSPQKLSNGIEQGVYPFGNAIKSDKGRRLFEIFEADFEKWVQNRLEGNYEERKVAELRSCEQDNVKNKDQNDALKNNNDITITIPINCVLSIQIPSKELVGTNKEERKLQAILRGTVKPL